MPGYGQVQYNTVVNSKILSKTNPYLINEAKARQRRVRSIASSTVIETGKSIRVTLA
jgi:hypothetical protein